MECFAGHVSDLTHNSRSTDASKLKASRSHQVLPRRNDNSRMIPFGFSIEYSIPSMDTSHAHHYRMISFPEFVAIISSVLLYALLPVYSIRLYAHIVPCVTQASC